MARYELFKNPQGEGFVLDVQSSLLESLNVRVVVPLLPEQKAPVSASRLNPVFTIEGSRYVMMTQYLSSVPETLLKSTVGDLSDHFDQITNALDMLFHGF